MILNICLSSYILSYWLKPHLPHRAFLVKSLKPHYIDIFNHKTISFQPAAMSVVCSQLARTQCCLPPSHEHYKDLKDEMQLAFIDLKVWDEHLYILAGLVTTRVNNFLMPSRLIYRSLLEIYTVNSCQCGVPLLPPWLWQLLLRIQHNCCRNRLSTQVLSIEQKC